MKKVTVNGKKVYARIDAEFMKLYDSLSDYILDIPSPHLAYLYSRENGVDTVLDRILRKLGD